MGHHDSLRPRDDADASTGGGGIDGLDDRLRAWMDSASDDPGRSWADRVLATLTAGALKGDVRLHQLIFRRIGAGRNSHRDVATYSIDDATARRVLEAARGPDKDRSVA